MVVLTIVFAVALILSGCMTFRFLLGWILSSAFDFGRSTPSKDTIACFWFTVLFVFIDVGLIACIAIVH